MNHSTRNSQLTTGWESAIRALLGGMSMVLVGCTAGPRTISSLGCADAIHANPKVALKDLESSAQGSPSGDAQLCVAYAHIALKQYPAAVEASTRAIALAPQDSLAWRMRAFARYRLGAFPLAIEDAQKANTIAKSGEGFEIIGKCKLRLGDAAGAAEDFRQWANLDHSIEARCWMGSALWESGDTAGALKAWELAQKIAPKDPEPLVWKAGFLFRAGDKDEALAAAEHAVKLAPDSPQALGTLARIQSWSGDAKGAEATIATLARSHSKAADKLRAELAKSPQPSRSGGVPTAPGT